MQNSINMFELKYDDNEDYNFMSNSEIHEIVNITSDNLALVKCFNSFKAYR